jgi:hypothetical protein
MCRYELLQIDAQASATDQRSPGMSPNTPDNIAVVTHIRNWPRKPVKKCKNVEWRISPRAWLLALGFYLNFPITISQPRIGRIASGMTRACRTG